MLQTIIEYHKNQWINSDECTIKPIISYIRNKQQLRDAQINALETYLFLKIKGQNKPLWQLITERFLVTENPEVSAYNHLPARAYLEILQNPVAKNVYDSVNQKINGKIAMPDLAKTIGNNAHEIDFIDLAKKMFYGINYTDYLFSLPMGAGKTFLMASIIYLDLYFAENEPDNKIFAHNFIILVPSGLKSSIVPSIKTIEKFDPTWIIPEPAASNLKKELKFEILDQTKNSSKEKRRQNPNAKKVSEHQPFDTLKGLVMVVNAEKVILDRLELKDNVLFEPDGDLKDKEANELRNIINKIPNLQIHIDEVHHAATDDIKLRQVVTKWNAGGTINSVLGYSGTPYLSSTDKINVAENVQLKFSQITNTVYYYPLTTAIKKFLKKPRVEQAIKLEPLQIIRKGVDDFMANYQNTVYQNGTCAKLAIYCGSIKTLEERIYPFLVGDMKIQPDIILKYHKGNKEYKLPQENETEFVSLDTPLSKKKIILLVQVGKEGWDCKSLSSVILSQKGDCPTNMVLQTSCRCLRQVDKNNNNETALIWLNEENAKALDKQLNDEQQTSIYEINRLAKGEEPNMVERFSRLDFLKLPKIDFYQLKVEYNTIIEEEEPNPEIKISNLDVKNNFNQAIVIQHNMIEKDKLTKDFLIQEKGEHAHFSNWLFGISKGSFNTISTGDLKTFEIQLKEIFNKITFEEKGIRYFNELYNRQNIQSEIRLAFHCRRSFETETEIIPQAAQMLIIEKLCGIPENNLLYPDKSDTKKIIDYDKNNTSIEFDENVVKQIYDLQINSMKGTPFFDMWLLNNPYEKFKENYDISQTVKSKNNTFHYLPYNFIQSAFELKFLKEVLTLKQFKELNLEIYYNGERELTDFRILCFAKKGKNYQKVGYYTPDFLIIKRNATEINKILIVETKGSGFAEQTAFKLRKQFVETEFLRMNNEKFGYSKFQYLFLEDNKKLEENLGVFNNKIIDFFK